MASADVYSAFYTKKLLVPNINGGERTSEKRKRVTRPASLSPLNPATALGALLSVALSSVTAKSNYMIPFVFISCQCTTMPTKVYSFERRRCSVYSDDTVQFQTAQVFNDTAIFTSTNFRNNSIIPKREMQAERASE